jgi:AraC family transcriptional regulator
MNFVTTGSCISVHNDHLPLLAQLRKYYTHRFEPVQDRSTPVLLTLKFVTRGEQYYAVDNSHFRVWPNCFLLLNPGAACRSLPATASDRSTLDLLLPAALTGNLFKQAAVPFPYLFNSLYEMTPLALNAIQPFLQEKEIQDDEQLYKAFLGINELLLYYQQLNASRVHAIKASRLETKEDLFIRLQQAKAYILSGFETISSVTEIAKACSLSQSLLTKHYAGIFGLSPRQHIIQLKLDYSKQLLQTTEMLITDIVSQVGFINCSSFIRLFRSLTGMTPRQYRVKFTGNLPNPASPGSLTQRLNSYPFFMV